MVRRHRPYLHRRLVDRPSSEHSRPAIAILASISRYSDSRCGMVAGMAKTRKVTITLPVEAVESIRGLVAAGKADSVSGFVQHAVHVSLDDISGWGVMLAQALQATGGELTREEREWAAQTLGLGRESDVA